MVGLITALSLIDACLLFFFRSSSLFLFQLPLLFLHLLPTFCLVFLLNVPSSLV